MTGGSLDREPDGSAWSGRIDRALRPITFLVGAITEIPHLAGVS
jgi:hypothetical protein